MKQCTHCGNPIPDDAQYCPHCGCAQNPKRISPIPFYLVGLLMLISSMVWLGRYLGEQPLSSPPDPTGTAGSIIETPTQKTPASSIPPTQAIPTNTVIPPTSLPTATLPPTPIVPSENPIGRIVFTCQIFKNENRNQICIMNADGGSPQRLTTNDLANHFYPSLSQDGKSIVFSSNQSGQHEIYEMDLNGRQTRLTSMGELYAPEISPDGKHIAFANSRGTFSSIWVMDRNGDNPSMVYDPKGLDAVDPTWSPDGTKILFALGKGDNKKLHSINMDGTGLQMINDEFTTRGRSDWSPDGNKIAGYTGGSWKRKIFIMNGDGSGLQELLSTGNVQAPGFSPDGGWVVFTGYIDKMGDGNGCEIYIMRLKDGNIERLTNNDYCDWQPRWGP